MNASPKRSDNEITASGAFGASPPHSLWRLRRLSRHSARFACPGTRMSPPKSHPKERGAIPGPSFLRRGHPPSLPREELPEAAPACTAKNHRWRTPGRQCGARLQILLLLLLLLVAAVHGAQESSWYYLSKGSDVESASNG